MSKLKKNRSFSKKIKYFHDFLIGNQYTILKHGKVVSVVVGVSLLLNKQALALNQSKTPPIPLRQNVATVAIDAFSPRNPKLIITEKSRKISYFEVAMQTVMKGREIFVRDLVKGHFPQDKCRYPRLFQPGGFSKTQTRPLSVNPITLIHTYEYDEALNAIKYTKGYLNDRLGPPVEEYYFNCPKEIYGNLNPNSVNSIALQIADCLF